MLSNVSKLGLKKSRSLDNIKNIKEIKSDEQIISIRNSYHGTAEAKTKVTPVWNHIAIDKHEKEIFEKKLTLIV